MAGNRKSIPDISEYIERFTFHRDKFKDYIDNYDFVFDINPTEYEQNKKLYEIYNVILNKLDKCDRNMFIYDWFNSDKKSSEKCKLFGLCVKSYNVYISSIRKKIREIILHK